MIDFLKHIDTSAFLFLNSRHNEFWDAVMFWASGELNWIPVYIFLFYLVYKKKGKSAWVILPVVAVLITLSDQASVHFFKNIFLRYRPTHNIAIQASVHIVNGYRGGLYGFVSSHAANTFALAEFTGLLLRKDYRHIQVYLFAWACFVSYSRIYLGVHYPADVLAGGLLGICLAFLVYKLYFYLMNRAGAL